jgi:polyhydroxybutyrate depolymerase
MEDYPDRSYDLVVPDAYDDSEPVPLILLLHGGGGNRTSAARMTCPDGDLDDPGCLHNWARKSGFAVALPDGTPSRLAPKMRTWNSGGGQGEWRCSSGRACREDVDDVAYIDAVLDHVAARIDIDPRRIYSTGLSNGASMSHRLACELSGRIAAIAPVGGGLQILGGGTCEPTRPVPVLHTHGTDDPCYRYQGGKSECPVGQRDKKHISTPRTLERWAENNGCAPEPQTEALPDRADDGTETIRHRYLECDADLVHLEVRGGGHTWPDGQQYLGADTIGPVPHDWGSEVIGAFFEAHAMPAAL